MKRLGTISLLLLPPLFAACPVSHELSVPAVRSSLSLMRPDAIARHMSVLADDEMEGRGTGTAGYRRAAEYVAREFRRLGLETAGDDGFLQSVPLVRAEVPSRTSSLVLLRDGEQRPLVKDEDCVVRGDFHRENSELEAQIVYVGFGLTIPETGHDDYAGIDVRGKVVALLAGAPASLPHNQRAFYSSEHEKKENAALNGAVGVIRLRSPGEDEPNWERTVRHSKIGEMSWVDPGGAPHGRRPELRFVATFSDAGAQALFEGAEREFAETAAQTEQGERITSELPSRIRVRIVTQHTRLTSPNVVAALRGADPALRDEYVVLTAHLDHVGIGEPLNGDAIHNGAYDNASGVAMLLEVARAFAGLPLAPRRSILFLALTGEEKGLLGSDYFVHHPTVDLERIVGNVNLDTVMMMHPLKEVVAFGAEHTTLGRSVKRAAKYLGLDLARDPIPEEVLFIRSDQYPFVRRGIPALFLVAGFETDDPRRDGLEDFREWLREIYHSPGDDMSQTFDFDAGLRFAQLSFAVTHLIANDPLRPAWVPGDFFGSRFAGVR